MAEELDDPREVSWHPRFVTILRGHDNAMDNLHIALAKGRPHHAWLLQGPKGIGKATLAYAMAQMVLGQGADPAITRRWIETRAHPDLYVLERSFTKEKPYRLRNEIVVEDARSLIDHFSRTASGGWRVAIVDCMDELNEASSNALLKLIEEPPAKTMLFLVCHQLGKVLPTLRSRCLLKPISPLSSHDTQSIIDALPMPGKSTDADRALAVELSNGSPGRALDLIGSPAASAFATFKATSKPSPTAKAAITAAFATAKTAPQDYRVFMGLLMEWLGETARQHAHEPRGLALAQAFAQVQDKQALTEAYNLDRKTAVLDHLYVLEDALKAA